MGIDVNGDLKMFDDYDWIVWGVFSLAIIYCM